MQLKTFNWRDTCETESINDRLNIYYPSISSTNYSMAYEIYKGLSVKNKYLHPKYFYDDIGSELFESICTTDEYYVTRTEGSILKKYSNEIISSAEDASALIELGSGSSIKTRYLIDSFIDIRNELHYSPIDVSSILIESSRELIKEISRLRISGIISEYEPGIELVNELLPDPKLIIFLGSSIGNFDIQNAKNFVKFISDNMIDEDYFLAGFDMVKDVQILNNAYNDKEGYTAAFNLNLLHRINNELGANFNLNKFEHKAFFNEKKSRIEMHLVSQCSQAVVLKKINEVIYFQRNETIHTENSYKFTNEMISEVASHAGLKIINTWNDEKKYFSLVMFKKRK